jgi:hypothetical protein
LSEACYSSIKESVLKDKTPEYRAGSCIKGTSAQIETNKLIRDYLIQQHAKIKTFMIIGFGLLFLILRQKGKGL